MHNYMDVEEIYRLECLVDEKNDEIKRLRTENQELKLQYLSDQGQWIEETGRLREALSEYACICTTRLCAPSIRECGWVARAALGEKE